MNSGSTIGMSAFYMDNVAYWTKSWMLSLIAVMDG